MKTHDFKGRAEAENGVVAGTANYMLTLLHAGIDYIHKRSAQYQPGTVTHHHGSDDHLKFLEEPFQQAIKAVHERMHALGIPH